MDYLTKEINATVDTCIYKPFMAACSDLNLTADEVLSTLMAQFAALPEPCLDFPPVDSVRQRKAELKRLTKRLKHVIDAEMTFLISLPDYMFKSDLAIASISAAANISQSVCLLDSAYDLYDKLPASQSMYYRL